MVAPRDGLIESRTMILPPDTVVVRDARRGTSSSVASALELAMAVGTACTSSSTRLNAPSSIRGSSSSGGVQNAKLGKEEWLYSSSRCYSKQHSAAHASRFVSLSRCTSSECYHLHLRTTRHAIVGERRVGRHALRTLKHSIHPLQQCCCAAVKTTAAVVYSDACCSTSSTFL